jgi:uroporphyrinogen-III synthase
VVFAIGRTTEEAIRQHRNGKVIVANAPDKVQLAREAIEYLGQIIKQG